MLYDNDGYDDDDDDADEYDVNDDNDDDDNDDDDDDDDGGGDDNAPFFALVICSPSSCRTHRDALPVASTLQHRVNRHWLTKV